MSAVALIIVELFMFLSEKINRFRFILMIATRRWKRVIRTLILSFVPALYPFPLKYRGAHIKSGVNTSRVVSVNRVIRFIVRMKIVI